MKKILYSIINKEKIRKVISFHVTGHDFRLQIETKEGIKEYTYIKGKLEMKGA